MALDGKATEKQIEYCLNILKKVKKYKTFEGKKLASELKKNEGVDLTNVTKKEVQKLIRKFRKPIGKHKWNTWG